MIASERPASRLAVGLLAALLGLGLAGCPDPQAQLAQRLERGESALSAGDYREAGLEFKSALQVDPNRAAAHWGLARAYLGEGRAAEAYWELRETIRLDPENEDAQLAFLRLLAFATRQDAQEILADVDRMLEERPEAWATWLLKARAQARLDLDEAAASFERAIELAPEEPLPVFQYAEFARRRGDRETAEAQLRRLVELDPGTRAWSALGTFLAEDRRRDADAEAAHRRALERAEGTERVAALRVLSIFLASRDRFDEAESLLEEALASTEDPTPVRYLLAALHGSRGDRARAEAMLVAAAEEAPDDPEPLRLLAQLRARDDDLDGAVEAIDRALERDPGDTTARLVRAGLLVDVGRRDEDAASVARGRAVLDAVLAQQPGHPAALGLRARMHIANGAFDRAEADLRRALDARPDSAETHFLLGQALVQQGDARGGRAALERAVELDPALALAQQSLARLYADLGEHELTVETGRRALAREPGDIRLRILVAQALARTDRTLEALGVLEEIPLDRRTAETWNAIGRVHLGRDELPAARAALARAHELAPARVEVLRPLLEIDARAGRLGESAERVADALAIAPEDPRLLRLAGEVALRRGDAVAAEEAFRTAIELDPNDVDAYAALASTMAVGGKPAEVIATYEEAVRANPQDARLHGILGSLYEARGLVTDAMESYERAIELDAGIAVAKNNLAWLLAENGGDLDRALDLAQEAKAALPDHPSIADTLGWVLYRKEIPSAAVGYLEEAEQRLEPGDPALGLVRYHLALAHAANDEPDRAMDAADAALATLADRPEASPEPAWAADLRALRDRMGARPAAASEEG